jgi:hypothetical protein
VRPASLVGDHDDRTGRDTQWRGPDRPR